MMTRHVILALVAATAALPSATLRAQRPGRGLIAEQLFTRARVQAGDGEGRVRLGGFGARLLWHPDASASEQRPALSWLADRAAVGGFVSYAPQRLGVSTTHYGVHADLRLPHPRGLGGEGRVTPLASLAAGAFRVARAAGEPATLANAAPLCSSGEAGRFCFSRNRVTLADGSHAGVTSRVPPGTVRTSLAITPALGLRVPILPGALAARAELRDVVVFRGGAIHNPELAAGVSLRL